MSINTEFKKYISGFFDGDGSITVEKQSSGYCLRIKFFQSNENLIKTIQRYYPILHKSNNSRRKENNRIEYELRAAGKQIEPLIDDLLQYSILKYDQLIEAKNFIQLINVKDKNEEKEIIYNKLKELKKTNNKNLSYEKLCKEYIAGLFDAEGSIGIYNSGLRVKITQKSDIIILQKIGIMYNNTNKINNYAISFYNINSKNILEDIQNFCIYKKPQIEIALKYIETINKKLTIEIKNLRENYKSQLVEHKQIDIDEIFFKNQESNKIYLQNCFNKFKTFSYNEMLNYCKMEEIKNMKTILKYENKIYNIENWEEFNIIPILEFCETNNQIQLYQYYRKKVSSLPLTGVIGRSIRILVKDQITQKYIGIMCLSSDVYSLGERDMYLKKETQNSNWKNENLVNIMNLSCCVPLQPFGFNTNGGKLLASLAFSKEIFDYYFAKYKMPLFGILTTSINGKSIQYDRLKNLKLIGFTKGFGSVNIPDKLYKVCQDYNNKWKIIEISNRIDRFTFLKSLLTHLNLSHDILKHNNKRGIYYGFIFSTKFENNYNLDELQNVNTIYNYWKDRWCTNRIKNLLEKKLIKSSLNLYTIEKFKDCKVFELPIIDDKILSDNLIKEILTYKSSITTQNEVISIINKKYNINVTKNDITKIYTGKIRPNIEDEEYNNLISKKSTNKRITDEQIYYILNEQKKEYKTIQKNFENKFKITISKSSISNIITKKILPLNLIKENDHKNTMETIQNKNTMETVKNTESYKINNLTNEQLLYIIKLKYKENITSKQASDNIKEQYNIYISRTIINKFWNGILENVNENITNMNEYQKMLEYTKKKYKPKKIVNIEIVKKSNHAIKQTIMNSIDINILKDIISKKCDIVNKTQEYIQKTYDITISINILKHFYLGKIKTLSKNITELNEYKEMLNIKKINKTSTIFTDIHKQFILNNKEKSSSEIQKIFIEKFKMNISIKTIYNIKKII